MSFQQIRTQALEGLGKYLLSENKSLRTGTTVVKALGSSGRVNKAIIYGKDTPLYKQGIAYSRNMPKGLFFYDEKGECIHRIERLLFGDFPKAGIESTGKHFRIEDLRNKVKDSPIAKILKQQNIDVDRTSKNGLEKLLDFVKELQNFPKKINQ